MTSMPNSAPAKPAAGGKSASLFASMNLVSATGGDDFAMAVDPQAVDPSAAAGASETEELRGKVVRRIYPQKFVGEDDFAVYAVELENKKPGKITYAGGYRPEKGERFQAKGKWVEYKGQPSFKALIMTPQIPKGAEGATTWLRIAKIGGVGKVTIDRLAEAFGERLPDVMEDVERLATVVKRGQAEAIAEAYGSLIGQPKLVAFLGDFGLREALIQKVLKRFGAASRRIVDENPWRLAEVIDGIGFAKADMIGRKAGLDMGCEARVKAGIRFALDRKTNQQGHCGLTRDQLTEAAKELLDLPRDVVAASIDGVIEDRDAIFDPDVDLIYPAGLHKSERLVARRLRSLAEEGDAIDEDEARAAVERAVESLGLARDESQIEAAVKAIASPVAVITGGPGTGKSTTQRIILAALREAGRKTVMAAPTGRAAKRLAEVTGGEASTCHRLLSFSAEKGDFLFDRSNPFKEDRFIVDEFSMIDVRLAASFLDAVRDDAGITIVGDVDQLPSVGPGQVLRDLIDSGAVPVVRLKTVHRQAGDSGIVVAAARINEGRSPLADGEKLDGFYMKTVYESYSGDEDIVADVVDFVSRRLRNAGFNPIDDIQVLAPMKPGPVGVRRLNAELKKALNPGTAENTATFKANGEEASYSIGDRVMQTRNCYTKRVYNGEVGTVVDKGFRTHEGKEEEFLEVDYSGHKATYSQRDASDITMAWASTVHKSQGCEFKVVIFVCPYSHRKMLNRNLFYTAVTRAKKVCLVLGNEDAVRSAVATENLESRATGLAKRLATETAEPRIAAAAP